MRKIAINFQKWDASHSLPVIGQPNNLNSKQLCGLIIYYVIISIALGSQEHRHCPTETKKTI